MSGDVNAEQVFEVPIEFPDDRAVPSVFEGLLPLTEKLAPLNEKIALLIREAQNVRRQREFLQGYAENPSRVMRAVIAQEVRDEALKPTQRTGYYYQDWIYDAVDRYAADLKRHKDQAVRDKTAYASNSRS